MVGWKGKKTGLTCSAGCPLSLAAGLASHWTSAEAADTHTHTHTIGTIGIHAWRTHRCKDGPDRHLSLLLVKAQSIVSDDQLCMER